MASVLLDESVAEVGRWEVVEGGVARGLARGKKSVIRGWERPRGRVLFRLMLVKGPFRAMFVRVALSVAREAVVDRIGGIGALSSRVVLATVSADNFTAMVHFRAIQALAGAADIGDVLDWKGRAVFFVENSDKASIQHSVAVRHGVIF
jgi:hypothetical protein